MIRLFHKTHTCTSKHMRMCAPTQSCSRSHQSSSNATGFSMLPEGVQWRGQVNNLGEGSPQSWDHHLEGPAPSGCSLTPTKQKSWSCQRAVFDSSTASRSPLLSGSCPSPYIQGIEFSIKMRERKMVVQ